MAHMYSLTRMTGRRRNDDRQVALASFAEINRRTFAVALASGVVGAFVSMLVIVLLMPFTGDWWIGFFAIPICVGAGLWLFDSRVRGDLGVHRFRHLLDARAAKAAQGIRIAGQPLTRPYRANVVTQYLEAPASTAPIARGVRVQKQGKASFYA